MSNRYKFISLETVLAKHSRELRGLKIHENDAIEWAGEALGFMKIATVSEEALLFVPVTNHQIDLPGNLQNIIQVAMHNDTTMAASMIQDSVDATGDQINLQWDYLDWYNLSRGTGWKPVPLADHTFFNSIVCTEQDPRIKALYAQCKDEYTIVQSGMIRKLRFSFKEGYVAVAYNRHPCDKETGYPMIPDNEYAINAINYYMTWKFWERYFWEGREGSQAKMQYANQQWEKYIRRFKGHAMMPFGVDGYENLKNQSNYLMPRRNSTQNFFGGLSNQEILPFKIKENIR